jgi:hypothetical protein
MDQHINELLSAVNDQGMASSITPLMCSAPPEAGVRHLKLDQVTYVRL